MAKKVEMYCTNCGSIGLPKKHTKGSFGIEVLLWICMIFPGLIYSMWRLTSKQMVCSSCESPSIMPASSPNAKAAIAGRGIAR